MKVSKKRLFSTPWKFYQTKEEISKGETSKTQGPLEVSYCPLEGVYLILDGHHRALEEKGLTLEVRRSEGQPTFYGLNDTHVNIFEFEN